jgi:hypothetical protein
LDGEKQVAPVFIENEIKLLPGGEEFELNIGSKTT